MLHNREFTVILLRSMWNAAKRNPRFKQILIEQGVPRRLPPKEDFFSSTRGKPISPERRQG
jgi:hypothetical protein